MSYTQSAVLCLITVRLDGTSQAWSGIFKSTVDAVLDALERVGNAQARITVKAIRR